MADDRVETTLADFGRDVRRDVVPPAYDALVTTSRRRRRAAAGAAAAAVLLVAGFAWGAQGFTDSSADRNQPAGDPHKTGDHAADGMSPDEIVDDPASQLVTWQVEGGAPRYRVAIWRCAESSPCHGNRVVAAFTNDGFHTRTLIELLPGTDPVVVNVGNGRFVVGDLPGALIIDPDGTTRDVTVDETAPTIPLLERLISSRTVSHGGWAALDPITAIAHPLNLPPGDGTAGLIQDRDGTIWGLAYEAGASGSVVWSENGGVTWEQHPLPPEFRNKLVQQVPNAWPGSMAFVVGGDGATLFPFDQAYRSLDGGKTWDTIDIPGPDRPYVSWSLTQYDGSLLTLLDSWSDDRGAKHPGAHPHGFYQSNGTDWSDLDAVRPLPVDLAGPDEVSVVDWYGGVVGEAVTIWVQDGQERIYESRPGQDGWQETPAR